MQETLLRACRHRAGFQGRSSFRAWLYRVAINVCLTWRARRAFEPPQADARCMFARACSYVQGTCRLQVRDRQVLVIRVAWDKPMLHRPDRNLGARPEGELAEDIAHVPHHSRFGVNQRLGDGAIAESPGDQRGDLALTWRKYSGQ